MNSVASVVHLHLKNKFGWFFLPWTILLVPTFGINFLIAFFVKTPIYTGGLSSIYIFMFILGAMTLGDTLPFSLGLSIRRTDYFLGTMLMLLAVSAVSAIGLLLLSLVEQDLIAGWGVALHFFYLPYLNAGPLSAQFWIYSSGMLHLYLLGFVISSFYYRFGRNGMYIFFGLAFLLFSLGGFMFTYFNWWGRLFGWLVQYSAFGLTLWMFPVTLGYALLAFLLLRKATA